MDTSVLIKRAMVLLEKKAQEKKEPSEELKSCLNLYSMVVRCVMHTLPEYEGSPSEEILSNSAEYRFIISQGGIRAICNQLRDRISESGASEQQECFELIRSAEELFNKHLVEE